jgi:hypothetical protein
MNGPNVSDLATLRAVIAHSQIIHVPASAGSACLLPAGFDAVDRAILQWIAAEGRRAGRRLALA